MQELLRRSGAAKVETSGVFDEATRAAVMDFQRAHELEPDGRVGPFTRIALYARAGGYERPRLRADAEKQS